MWRVVNEEKKRALREALLSRRKALPKHECLLWGRAIQTRALQLPAYAASHSVALYSPAQNEVGTDDILNRALIDGRKVFYPRTGTDGAGLFIRAIASDDLCAGRHGILEPSGTEGLSDRDRQDLVVFVPGVAFDAAGNRLGRGKGWYDRILAKLGDKPKLVALAYDFQVVEEVPTEAWDRKVHFIVTETKLIVCDAANAPLSRVSQ
ncbi:MAG TPA: 5-formyltetrahydrofolate cyclo-ligase [Candidatus Binatia bacterium]|jgi:5-formyltetrahydrofolate cyclo-ligase